jgi:signal transduction histidine kinase
MDESEKDGREPRDRGLADVDSDRLLREVLVRVQGMLDEQARLRLLLDAVVAISSELTLDGVLTRIVRSASTLVGARYAALGVQSEGPERVLRTFVHHGMGSDVVERIGDLPAGRGLLGLLIDEPRPLRLRDIAAHPASYGFPEHHPAMTSFLGVPVRTRERVSGHLYLTEKEGGQDFTEVDESIAVALAAAAGVAIENATLYEEAERRQAWLSATVEIISLLSDDTPTDRALQAVADRARSVSGADVAWVVSGSDPQDLHLEVVAGAPVDREAMHALPMHRSLASLVVSTGESISVDDLATDPRAVDPSSLDGWPQLGPMMALPLPSSSGIEGVISLAWTPERIDAFRRLDPRLPTSFAEQAALALHVARSRGDRERMSLLEDRDRIGRDLHDLVIQRLFGVGLGLDSTVRMVPAGEPAQRLRQAVVDIDDTIKDIRRAIFALGTLEGSTDLQTEIEILVDRAAATMKLRPKLRLEGPIRTTVPAAVTDDLLAVVGEALTNVSRHAHASTVEVRVVVDHDTLEVIVTDDGIGMPSDALESGLHNMRERAAGHGGELVVESEAGTGTTLTWSVPLVEGGSTIQGG